MSTESVWDFIDVFDVRSKKNDFAFVILNQPITCEPDLVISLWERASLRVTVDGGTNRWLDFIEKNDLKNLPLPHYITGDFDSITPKTKKYFEDKDATFVHTPDQDFTDFTKALIHVKLVSEQQSLKLSCVIALCENSGRLDQIFANIETLFHSQKLVNIPLIELASGSLTWLLLPGNHVIHVKEEFVSKQYPCGLIPMSGATEVTTSGLKWNLENSILAFGELVSTSNTFSEKIVRIKCDKFLVWTMQFLSEQ